MTKQIPPPGNKQIKTLERVFSKAGAGSRTDARSWIGAGGGCGDGKNGEKTDPRGNAGGGGGVGRRKKTGETPPAGGARGKTRGPPGGKAVGPPPQGTGASPK